MKKKLVSVLLATTMVMSMISGCGSTANQEVADTSAETPAADVAEAPAEEVAEADTVEVSSDPFYIYSWNTELGDRLEFVYAKYPEMKDRVVYVNVGDSAVYQEKIDALLQTPDAEEYPDLIAMEAGYIMKYTNSDYTLPVTDLGITDADLTEMYPYTLTIATDQRDDSLKGLSWQSCPGSMMYRRSLALEYLGTDDPAEVQEYFKDWDTFLETAEKLNADSNGELKVLSSNADVSNVFNANKTSPWVDATGTFVMDPAMEEYMDVVKVLEEKNLTGKTSTWSEEWNAGAASDNVFSYFGCTWFLHWTIKANCGGEAVGEGTYGDWAMCQGPESYYWGGTWLGATVNCSDTAFAGQIMQALCCDTEIMTSMSSETLDYVNNTAAMQTLSDQGLGAYEFLGGQDFIEVFSPLAEQVDVSWMSAYDQKVNELFQTQLDAYSIGQKDKETAIADFKTAVQEAYPSVTVE
ncbi:MAG: hypothetical protein R3Y24_03025 [Eubacteriales bacterium]